MKEWLGNRALLMMLTSALINLLVDVWSRWFGSSSERRLERRSRLWAAVAAICRGGGIDVVTVIRGIGEVLWSIRRRDGR